MSDLFDAPATGAPRAGGVSVADAASRDVLRGEVQDAVQGGVPGAGVMAGMPGRGGAGFGRGLAAVPVAGLSGGGLGWPMGLAPQRPADADPEDEDADDLDDDLDDDEDDEDDDLDDLDDDEDDEDDDDDFDDDDEDLDDDLDDDLMDLDDEYDNDDDDDRAPGRPDYEND
jgi:hypothetical protein